MTSRRWFTVKTLAIGAGVGLTALGAFGDPASITRSQSSKGDTAGQAVHTTAVAPRHEAKGEARAKMASTPKQEAIHQPVAKASVAVSHEGIRQAKAPHGYDSVQLFPGEL